jgi:hypothetical protein
MKSLYKKVMKGIYPRPGNHCSADAIKVSTMLLLQNPDHRPSSGIFESLISRKDSDASTNCYQSKETSKR